MEKLIESQIARTLEQVEQQVDSELNKLEKLPDDDELEILRKHRLRDMKRKEALKQKWAINGHGEYIEIDESDFFRVVKASERVVIHFYRNDTFNCKIMDKHLKLLAQKHLETRFVKINADRANFLTTRFKINIVPRISMCKDELIFAHIVGTKPYGETEDFKTEMVEWKFGKHEVIFYKGNLAVPPTEQKKFNLSRIQNRNVTGSDSDLSD
ncbi:Thioredoxin domain-containing protein 9 [Intoshia linei]|uniref:Thioredoxin domain-containing protein 9 n=1 Tax=Intoshia linei TaxID=1819745 RepID=A0A177B2P6_9BILA|nr:Thioredoxin domain-containing protein 9 [Intoshia linei]